MLIFQSAELDGSETVHGGLHSGGFVFELAMIGSCEHQAMGNGLDFFHLVDIHHFRGQNQRPNGLATRSCQRREE